MITNMMLNLVRNYFLDISLQWATYVSANLLDLRLLALNLHLLVGDSASLFRDFACKLIVLRA